MGRWPQKCEPLEGEIKWNGKKNASLSRNHPHSPQMKTILINSLMNRFIDARLGTGTTTELLRRRYGCERGKEEGEEGLAERMRRSGIPIRRSPCQSFDRRSSRGIPKFDRLCSISSITSESIFSLFERFSAKTFEMSIFLAVGLDSSIVFDLTVP